MNLIDRAVGWVSPETGLRRLRARAALRVATLAYEGARVGRSGSNWHRPSTSSNTEIGTDLVRLRNSSRDLFRNDPFSKKAMRELQTKIVGTGIMPQSRAKNERTRKALDEAFARWSTECDAAGRLSFAALQSLATKTIIESGECLLRYRPRLAKDNLTIPLQLQLLEPDFLDLSKNETTRDGYILHGVQFDRLERRVGYWLFSAHPGDPLMTGWNRRGLGLVSNFISVEDVEHGYEVERIGQVRGVPRCAAVIAASRDLSEYGEAVRVRKKIEACFTAFVHNADPDTDNVATTTTDEETGERIETFEPGMVHYLNNGKDITFSDPKTSGAEPDYLRVQHRELAAGWLIPYEVLTGDLSQINYSSYRGGLLGFRDLIYQLRWNVVIPFAGDPVWKRFCYYAQLAGIVDEYDDAVEWAEPKFDLLDREKEAEADEREMRLGTLTWPQAVGAQGRDPEKQLDEISTWNKKFDEAGVVLDCDPRKTSRSGGAAAGTTSEDPSMPAPAPAAKPTRVK